MLEGVQSSRRLRGWLWRWILGLVLLPMLGMGQGVPPSPLQVSVRTDGGLVLSWTGTNQVLLRAHSLASPFWIRVPGKSPVTLSRASDRLSVQYPSAWYTYSVSTTTQYFALIDAGELQALQKRLLTGKNLDACSGGDCEACRAFCSGFVLVDDLLSAPRSEAGACLLNFRQLYCTGADGIEETGDLVSYAHHLEFGP